QIFAVAVLALAAISLTACADDSISEPVATFRLAQGDLTLLDIPYPNDLYRGAGGGLRIAGIPRRAAADTAGRRRVVEALTAPSEDGFGATTGVFFGYRGSVDIDPGSLTDDSAMLINLADGTRVPVERHARADDHVIVVAPRPGEVLLQGGKYA